ncbi:MAG: GGDEF domain-containing protein [Spirulina sp.]
MDDPHINLNPMEQAIMGLYRRVGARGVIALITAGSISLSVLATLTLVVPQLSVDYSPRVTLAVSLAIAVAVPLLVAPVSVWLIVSLLVRLDTAYLAVLRLSTTDPLTGAANRRGFFTEAANHLDTWRYADSGLVGMVDLDCFKTLNDRFGHRLGDEALCTVVHQLHGILNEGLVGRLGGDEFAFLITGSPTKIEQIQQEIRAQCSHFTLNHRDSDEPILVSTSIGMVLLHRKESFDQALARADEALYAEKRKTSTHRDISPVQDLR